jgi:hypothetical protein
MFPQGIGRARNVNNIIPSTTTRPIATEALEDESTNDTIVADAVEIMINSIATAAVAAANIVEEISNKYGDWDTAMVAKACADAREKINNIVEKINNYHGPRRVALHCRS